MSRAKLPVRVASRARPQPSVARIRYVALLMALLSSVASCGFRSSEPQQPAKLPRVGFIHSGSPQPYHSEFQQGLGDAGYVDGKNVIVEYRYAEGQADRLPAIVESLVALGVDVIVAADTGSIRAAKETTATVPIVMGVSADPVAAGFVESLARPGANITGLSILGIQTTAKRVELLKELVPTATRIGLLLNPQNPVSGRQIAESQAAGEVVGAGIYVLPVQGAEDLDLAFQTAIDQQLGGLIMIGDPIFSRERARLEDLLVRHKIPALVNPEHIETGGLVSYVPSVGGLLYRSAAYVDKILKGANPAELPVEQPTRFEFIINLRTAEALGIEVPTTLMLQVDRLIK